MKRLRQWERGGLLDTRSISLACSLPGASGGPLQRIRVPLQASLTPQGIGKQNQWRRRPLRPSKPNKPSKPRRPQSKSLSTPSPRRCCVSVATFGSLADCAVDNDVSMPVLLSNVGTAFGLAFGLVPSTPGAPCGAPGLPRPPVATPPGWEAPPAPAPAPVAAVEELAVPVAAFPASVP